MHEDAALGGKAGHIEVDVQKLRQLAGFEVQGDDQDALSGLLGLVSDFLSAGRVSLLLLDTHGDKPIRLKMVALHGNLPQAAWLEKPSVGQGIAGKVFAEGKSLMVADIHAANLKAALRHPGESASFIACPVRLAGQTGGVLNVSDGVAGSPFTAPDLARAEIAADLVGRAIQMARLQGMLDSSFARMAMSMQGVSDAGAFMKLSAQEPQKVAKILAKAFYKEMQRCGFTSNQILHAAGEIVSELTGSLNRHKQRKRASEPDQSN